MHCLKSSIQFKTMDTHLKRYLLNIRVILIANYYRWMASAYRFFFLLHLKSTHCCLNKSSSKQTRYSQAMISTCSIYKSIPPYHFQKTRKSNSQTQTRNRKLNTSNLTLYIQHAQKRLSLL